MFFAEADKEKLGNSSNAYTREENQNLPDQHFIEFLAGKFMNESTVAGIPSIEFFSILENFSQLFPAILILILVSYIP